MIVPLMSFICGVGFVWYCLAEHMEAKRLIALGRLNPDYNLWPVFAFITGLLFTGITAMTYFHH